MQNLFWQVYMEGHVPWDNIPLPKISTTFVIVTIFEGKLLQLWDKMKSNNICTQYIIYNWTYYHSVESK